MCLSNLESILAVRIGRQSITELMQRQPHISQFRTTSYANKHVIGHKHEKANQIQVTVLLMSHMFYLAPLADTALPRKGPAVGQWTPGLHLEDDKLSVNDCAKTTM